MKQNRIEYAFNYKGLPCIIVINRYGCRCGYVGIPKGHCLYGTPFDSDIKYDFYCHGGITYISEGKDSKYPIGGDFWWFGFDCMHSYDKPDYEKAIELYQDDPEVVRTIEVYNQDINEINKKATVKSLEFVKNECIKLAEQIVIYEKSTENLGENIPKF